MKTITIQLSGADENRIRRILELQFNNTIFKPTEQEILRTALGIYWMNAEARAEKRLKENKQEESSQPTEP